MTNVIVKGEQYHEHLRYIFRITKHIKSNTDEKLCDKNLPIKPLENPEEM